MNYRDLFYKIYKEKWLRLNVSTNELVDYIYEKAKGNDDYQFKNGMYVCYNEFIDNEYQDEEVMKFILDNEELYQLYLEHKNDVKEELIDKILKGSGCEYYDSLDDYIRYHCGYEWDDEGNVLIEESYSKQTISLESFLNGLSEEELKGIIGEDEEEDE